MPIPTWPDPPGYREAVAALRGGVPWQVVTSPHGNVATIRVSPAALPTAPYRWLNGPQGRSAPREVAIQTGLGLVP